MSFTGFSKQSLTFLDKLARNNERDWFHANRDMYEAELLGPAKDFVVAMGDRLFSLSPDINAEPRVNGSIRRIARDIRFSPNKKPYKEYFDFFFRYAGASKEGPGYFLRVTPKKMWVGGGAYVFDKAVLPKYRDAVAADKSGAALEAAVKKLRKAGIEVGGEHYKRVPRGYDAEHPRGELLRHAGLYGMLEFKIPKEYFSPAFATFCTKHFKKIAPLNEWIVDNVAP